MKIAVVGAGAMGSLFGGLLKQAGHDVWLVDVWDEHVNAIKNSGLLIEAPEGTVNINMKATTDISDVGDVETIFVFVKAYATEIVVKNITSNLKDDTIIVTLQNGIGNVEAISKVVGQERVVAGTTSYGATLLSAGKVLFAGKGHTYIGRLDGKNDGQVKNVANALNSGGIVTELTTNALGMLWSKVLVNVGINALTAIAGVSNGQLLKNPDLKKIMLDAVTEAVEVVRAKKIDLAFSDPIQKVQQVAEATCSNFSSMAQDIMYKRRTEIDFINGAIIAEGQKLGIPTPVNSVLTNLVKALESKYTG